MLSQELPAVSEEEFRVMAHGDVEGFRELAGEFFADVRNRRTLWEKLLQEGDFRKLLDELHRCKGGASIFGMKRIVSQIRAAEVEQALELDGFNLDLFFLELAEAEKIIATLQA